MVVVTYVANDGLVGHQWKERPSGLRMFNTPVSCSFRVGGWEWVGGGAIKKISKKNKQTTKQKT